MGWILLLIILLVAIYQYDKKQTENLWISIHAERWKEKHKEDL